MSPAERVREARERVVLLAFPFAKESELPSASLALDALIAAVRAETLAEAIRCVEAVPRVPSASSYALVRRSEVLATLSKLEAL